MAERPSAGPPGGPSVGPSGRPSGGQRSVEPSDAGPSLRTPSAGSSGAAPAGGSRRHRPQAQARRDALLRAAVEVAAERGTAGTTHRAVTERAGLPLATASYFFSSIDELVAEALRTHVADEAARLEGLAGELSGDDHHPDDIAAALAEASMPEGPLPFALAQFEAYLQAARDAALREPVADALAVYEHVAEVALRAAGAPADAAAAAGPAFNALADGFSLHRLARPQADDVDALRRALRLLFLGLLVESGETDRAAALAAGDVPDRPAG